jgi:hypothetical protein
MYELKRMESTLVLLSIIEHFNQIYNIEIAMLAMIIGIGILAIGSLLLVLNHLLFNSQLVIVAFGLDKGSSLSLSSIL